MGQPARRRGFRVRRHPKVKRALVVCKNLMKKGSPTLKAASSTRGGNPKWHFINKTREALKKEHLTHVEFKSRVREAIHKYERDELTRIAAGDAWRAHRLNRNLDALQCLSPTHPAPSGTTEGHGPWRLGDSFWPLSEATLTEWMRTHTREGGLRALANEQRAAMRRNLLIDEDVQLPSDARLAPLAKTCFEKHPGVCRSDKYFDKAKEVASELNTFKCAWEKSIM